MFYTVQALLINLLSKVMSKLPLFSGQLFDHRRFSKTFSQNWADLKRKILKVQKAIPYGTGHVIDNAISGIGSNYACEHVLG